MSLRDVLLILHVLLLVAWLGIDVGVFYSSFVMRRPGLSTETRTQIRHIMRNLDLAPRVSLILMIPVALALAEVNGFWLGDRASSDAVVAVVAVVAIAWAGLSVWSYRQRNNPTEATRIFDKADWTMRGLTSAFFVSAGLASVVADGPFAPRYVGWKALLFGIIIALGLWIRFAARRYVPHLRELLDKGESPERLAAVGRAIRPVYPGVLAVWGTLVAIVAIAVIKP